MTVVHITTEHSAFDGRIFYKELCSLAKFYDCYELSGTPDGKTLRTIAGEKREAGIYNGVKVLPFKVENSNKISFFERCIRHFFPSIYAFFLGKIFVSRTFKVILHNNIQPDVIHYHDIQFAPAAKALKRKFGCKLIFDSHEFFFSYPFNRGITRKSCRNASRMLLNWKDAMKNSDFTIDCTKTMDNFVSIIRNDDFHGIVQNTSMFAMNTVQRSITGKEKIVLVHEGSLRFDRGLRLMIELFRDEYVQKHFQLRIVGSLKGGEKTYFSQKCHEYNITDEHIYFTGWVDYMAVPNALSKGDIGVIFFEKTFNTFYGMPNKLYNYHIVGIPVLSVHCADLSDTILQCGTGVVVERNVESIKLGLVKLAEHYSEYQKNVLTYQQRFHWSSDEKQLLEIYKNIEPHS